MGFGKACRYCCCLLSQKEVAVCSRADNRLVGVNHKSKHRAQRCDGKGVPKDRLARTMGSEKDNGVRDGISGLKERQRRDAVVKWWNKKNGRQRAGGFLFILMFLVSPVHPLMIG